MLTAFSPLSPWVFPRSILLSHVPNVAASVVLLDKISPFSHRDQRITDDVTQFADSLSQLFTSSFKPLVDAILFSHKLAKSGGIHGPNSPILALVSHCCHTLPRSEYLSFCVAPLAMMAYFVATSSFLHTVTPPFGEVCSFLCSEAVCIYPTQWSLGWWWCMGVV